MTNADKIRNMTDDELTKFIDHITLSCYSCAKIGKPVWTLMKVIRTASLENVQGKRILRNGLTRRAKNE